MSTTEETPVILKWSKQTFELTLTAGESAMSFKERVKTLTGVPVQRQKLLVKGGSCWKGPLKDDAILDTTAIKTLPLIVTLIGSAETLSGPKQKTTFVEDMTTEELQAEDQAQAQAAMATAIGMIPALQLPPHHRDDGKQEMYAYNRLVTGLPQRQIEQQLLLAASSQQQSECRLQGKVAMTLGMELRRAYVNDLAVLMDGTCVSAMDDGHVLLWKHGAQQHDVIHSTAGYGGSDSGDGVDSVVALSNYHHPGAFATAGRGFLQIWTMTSDDSVKPVLALPTSMPGTSPASLVSIPIVVQGSSSSNTITCLAARFRITRQSNPTQFHLPPQNESERQRRVQAEAQEQAIQQALVKASCSVQLWFGSSIHALQSQVLTPPSSTGSSAVTCLTALQNSERGNSVMLVVGDALGGLRLWKLQNNNENGGIEFYHQGLYQLILASRPGSRCSIVCLQSLQNGRLAVSTNKVASTEGNSLLGAVPVAVPTTRAVHVLDFSLKDPTVQTTLSGHANDAVICMCELPNGDLLTGGGRLDAKLQLWTKEQVDTRARWQDNDGEQTVIQQTKAHKTLVDVGYVFALAVLPDLKKDSNYFAVAAARYNTVKIIL